MPVGRTRPSNPVRGPARQPSQPKRDPGAYIGRLPERVAETIPGGVGRGDERDAAVATQPGPVRGEVPAAELGRLPEGHRTPSLDADRVRREAGENR